MNPDQNTLLVVEDDPDLREILALSLERKGFKVIGAANGVEALSVVREQPVAVVISDVNMPGGNGVELLENVKKINIEIPVILFVTASTGITIDEAYDKGAEALFAKPYDFKALHQTVVKIIDARFVNAGAPRPARHDLTLTIDFSYGSGDPWRQAKITNLGRGGFFIKIEREFLKIDQTIHFRVHFGDDLNAVAEGHGLVRWCRRHSDPALPSGCGIEFLNLEGEGLKKVRELINFAQTRQFIPKS